MCTAIRLQTKNFYFGRNLDLERGFGEEVIITPRAYPFALRNGQMLRTEYAIIGVGVAADGYPLYFDATNEKGLSMAGLNFPHYAKYRSYDEDTENITPFELIPLILGSCETVSEAKKLLACISVWSEPFAAQLPLTPLHWLIADPTQAITVEPLENGLQIYANSVGVLTNSPPFPYQMTRLADYQGVTAKKPTNRFACDMELPAYSLGMGAMGLPGDPSSCSRFVRAAFGKCNSRTADDEQCSVSQFFHILDTVAQLRGVTQVQGEEYEYTRYSSCCNASKGIYYFTTYENRQIRAVNLADHDLNGNTLCRIPMNDPQQILYK